MNLLKKRNQNQTGNQNLPETNANFSKFMGCSKSSSKREGHIYTHPSQERRKIPNKQYIFTTKGNKIIAEIEI